MDRLIRAPESLAQSVLVALCDDSRIQARALRYLGELEDYASKRAAVGGNEDRGDSSNASNPSKRKKSMEPGQICLQCKHAFTPSGNGAEACLYHPGELERDDEHATWDDWDEKTFGEPDTLENMEDYPEGFLWNCCDNDGTQPGCTNGYHVAIKRNNVSKTRGSGDSSDGDFVRMFEGRALKANEFVNELLWTDSWDGYAASRSLGGWRSSVVDSSELAGPIETEVKEQKEGETQNHTDTTQLERRSNEVGESASRPPKRKMGEE